MVLGHDRSCNHNEKVTCLHASGVACTLLATNYTFPAAARAERVGDVKNNTSDLEARSETLLLEELLIARVITVFLSVQYNCLSVIFVSLREA